MRNAQPLIVGILLAVVALLSLLVVAPYFSTLFLAIALSIVFWPFYHWLSGRVRWQWLAALATVLLIILIVLVPLTFFGALIFNQAQDLYQNITEGGGIRAINDFLASIRGQVNALLPAQFQLEDGGNYFGQMLQWLIGNLGSFFSSVASGVLGFVLSMFVLYYLLKDGLRFRDYVIENSPLDKKYASLLFDKLRVAVGSVVRGSLVVALLQGVVSGIGYTIFGVPHAALWGGFTAIAALVPTVGTALIILPVVLYLFFSGEPLYALGLLLWGMTAVGLLDNALAPKLIGRGARIHPVVVLLGVLGGVALFGPIGFIVGPVIFAMLVALMDIYAKMHREGE